MRASRILPLARTSRCAIVGSGTRNARAISGGGQPAEQPQRQRDLRGAASAGWQQVKISRSRSSRTAPSSAGSSRRVQQRGLGVAVVAGGLAAQPVDRPVAGGGDDPAGRARRQAVGRPALRPPRRRRPGPPPRRRRCRRRRGPGRRPRGRTRSRKTRSTRRPVARSPRERPHLDRQRRRAARACRPQSSAASRSRRSMIEKPPRCSLPSANGPSVVEHVAVAAAASTVAVLGGCRPPANTQAPASRISWLTAVDVRHDLLPAPPAAGSPPPVGLVHGEQVLGHRRPPRVGAGSLPALTLCTNGRRPDRQVRKKLSAGERLPHQHPERELVVRRPGGLVTSKPKPRRNRTFAQLKTAAAARVPSASQRTITGREHRGGQARAGARSAGRPGGRATSAAPPGGRRR